MRAIDIRFAILLLLLSACSKQPSAEITDKFLKVIKPGQMHGLVKLRVVEFDSMLGYPIKEEPLESYSIVDRIMHKAVDKDETVKMYFNKENEKFCWKVWDAEDLSDFYFTDTLSIQPKYWYKLSTEKYNYDIYFFLEGVNGIYYLRYKPRLGAY